ncbi:5-formyltetrahydrofolate cyclo-ligase [Longibacter salinarum]|uniref:5-formyltetrahydrofolate cyclo-ligase n=1 Tax=Longibacter salinarum TaxID=1850348 RepID=A0A2A8D3Q6_9BACT|nr:5-formyltetrahydrofolate cyclo-ligase [Longibacter salinarum]PEN15268.1 5-formyltetrahydrofolate cyclo-ligase [Longibacter salinarum]
MPSSATKSELRQHFDATRKAMDRGAITDRSKRIARHVLNLPAIRGASCVHAYWPIPEQNEVDTRYIIDALVERDVDVALPVVTSFEAGTPEMAHRRFTGRSDLQRNEWNIAEPIDGPEVLLSNIDAVIVPALGAGLNGHRIGHGWGYYDAFLKDLDPSIPRILLAFDDCVRPHVPCDAHDIPVHIIVTESGLHKVASPDDAPDAAGQP